MRSPPKFDWADFRQNDFSECEEPEAVAQWMQSHHSVDTNLSKHFFTQCLSGFLFESGMTFGMSSRVTVGMVRMFVPPLGARVLRHHSNCGDVGLGRANMRDWLSVAGAGAGAVGGAGELAEDEILCCGFTSNPLMEKATTTPSGTSSLGGPGSSLLMMEEALMANDPPHHNEFFGSFSEVGVPSAQVCPQWSPVLISKRCSSGRLLLVPAIHDACAAMSRTGSTSA